MPAMDITTKIGCKIACVYCPQDRIIKAYTKRSNELQMSFDVFKICVDKIPLDVDIHFSGMCEPWLNPECTKMLLYAHKRGHKLWAFTTLVGMTLSDIDLLQSVPFEHFYVHLPSDAGYENIKVDENYLNLLDKICKSDIKVLFLYHGDNVHHEVKVSIGQYIKRTSLCTRAGNIKIENISIPTRKRGVIGCRRNLSHNTLLPNGEVTLCCMDFGIQHVLGSLISSDYDSLFCGREFLKVKRGMRDESLDILCRYCDTLAYDVNLFAKIYNSYLPQLTNIRSLRAFLSLLRKLFLSGYFLKMKIFIDLGAYDGDTIERALKWYKNFDNFYAFEPLSKNFKVLKKKFNSYNNIFCLNTAADVVDGKSKLYLGNEYGDLGGSLCSEKTTSFKNGTELVKTMDFSKFIIDNFNLKDEIILKIDIEGKEYDILEKMIKDGSINYINTIFCEWHYDRINIPKGKHENLIRRLNELGFTVIGENCWDEFTEVLNNWERIGKVKFSIKRGIERFRIFLKHNYPKLYSSLKKMKNTLVDKWTQL